MATQTMDFEVKKPNGSDGGGMMAIEPAVTPPDSKAALKLMRKPFEANQISKMCRPTKKDNPPGNCKACGGYHKLPSVQLSYVGHAALTDRLLDADPEWTWEPLAYAPNGTPLLDSDGGMWIKLTVAGVTRLGYGDAQGKTGGDATKERIGDALRNAAMRFGAALELWHKGTLHLVEAPVDTETNQEVSDGLSDERFVQLRDGIANAGDKAELERLYKAACKEANGYQDSMREFNKAKNQRYRELHSAGR